MVRRWVVDKASLVHARCSTVVGLTRQDLLQGATILALDPFTIVYATGVFQHLSTTFRRGAPNSKILPRILRVLCRCYTYFT